MIRPLARLPALALALCLKALPAQAADLTVDANSHFLIDATINGHPVRLRVDPETSGYIILNPETVTRIGLRRSMLGSSTRIGPVRLTGSSKVARVRIGDTEGNRRLVWIDRPAVEDADGLIGPADMPYDRVTFTLRPGAEGEAAYALPMEFVRSAGLSYPLTLGEQVVRVQFSLVKPDSMATAAAGALLASTYGGGWTGEARDQLIEFGVVRPVRPLVLQRPAELNGFGFSSFLVRTSDNRGNLDLPPEPDADPSEIVVTGSNGRRSRAVYSLTLGRDRLSACSSLVWDNRSRQLTLRCSLGVQAP